jgi:hypothetical protein
LSSSATRKAQRAKGRPGLLSSSATRKAQRAKGRPVLLWVVVGALVFAAGRVNGQGVLPPATGTPGTPGEVRSVAGRVLRGGATPEPLGGQVVVLHRISADSSGPVDSVRSSASGAYRFRYRLAGPRSMYIVSTRHDGIAYFTSPLRERDVTGPDADVAVYDTTSVPFPMTIRARHFVVSPPDESGLRRVVDVFEVANDSGRTLVGGPGGSATWSVRLPEGIRDPGASGGDMPPDAFRFTGGNAELVVPFPPGARQLVLTYGMPPGARLEVPMPGAVETLEVLVEGSGVEVSGVGLATEPPVTMEGRSFQRYLASPPGGAFTIAAAGGGGRAGRLALLAVAVVAVALGIVLGRRGPRGAAAPAPVRARTDTDALAREVAALDTVFQDATRQSAAAQAHYRARRETLMARLQQALAVEHQDAAP